MKMIRTTLLIITFMLLGACDAYDDMSSMFEKQNLVQEYIKKTNGYETQVGFNINNGVLSQVTVYFQSKEVKDISVKELEKISLVAVAQSFKLTPQTLNIAIQSNPDEENYKELQKTKVSNHQKPAKSTRRE